jgi:hypothetical protein
VIGFLAALGRGTTRWLARVGALARFAFEASSSAWSLPRAGRRAVLVTADSLMGETRGRIGSLHDSLTATSVEAPATDG